MYRLPATDAFPLIFVLSIARAIWFRFFFFFEGYAQFEISWKTIRFDGWNESVFGFEETKPLVPFRFAHSREILIDDFSRVPVLVSLT